MFVLITYDVNITSLGGTKRLRQVAKSCVDYGQRVQNSVFECILSEAQYVLLKSKLSGIIDNENDSIRFYIIGKKWNRKVEIIGKDFGKDLIGELIV